MQISLKKKILSIKHVDVPFRFSSFFGHVTCQISLEGLSNGTKLIVQKAYQ